VPGARAPALDTGRLTARAIRKAIDVTSLSSRRSDVTSIASNRGDVTSTGCGSAGRPG